MRATPSDQQASRALSEKYWPTNDFVDEPDRGGPTALQGTSTHRDSSARFRPRSEAALVRVAADFFGTR